MDDPLYCRIPIPDLKGHFRDDGELRLPKNYGSIEEAFADVRDNLAALLEEDANE